MSSSKATILTAQLVFIIDNTVATWNLICVRLRAIPRGTVLIAKPDATCLLNSGQSQAVLGLEATERSWIWAFRILRRRALLAVSRATVERLHVFFSFHFKDMCWRVAREGE